MSPDMLSILRAAPSSRDVAATIGRIAGRVDDLEPAVIGRRLRTLQAMGLVEEIAGGWSRTPVGDREAGRARG